MTRVALRGRRTPRWTDKDSKAARAEGWDVFHVDDRAHQRQIQIVDEPASPPCVALTNDYDAVGHVWWQAIHVGSRLHRRALRYVMAAPYRSLKGAHG